MSLRGSALVAMAGAATLLLGGCAYDYLQHSDRVGYATGDAVKHNLEAETTNPSKHTQYVVGGLGKNGSVLPPTASPAPSN